MGEWSNDRWQMDLKRALIDNALSPDNTIVAAVPGAKIRVHNLVLIAAGTVIARFESGAGGDALTGQINLALASGFAPGWDPDGHFETNEGEALSLELSTTVSVDGWVKYAEIRQHQ